MEFSTEAVEKMAEILANEMGKVKPEAQDIREVETGMRAFLQKVGAEGLKRYLERADEIEPEEEEIKCECERKR